MYQYENVSGEVDESEYDSITVSLTSTEWMNSLQNEEGQSSRLPIDKHQQKN